MKSDKYRFRFTTIIIALAVSILMLNSGFRTITNTRATEPTSQSPTYYDTSTNYSIDKTGSGSLYLSDPNSMLCLFQENTWPYSVMLSKKGTISNLYAPMERERFLTQQWIVSSNLLYGGDSFDTPMRNQTYWYNYNGYPTAILMTDYNNVGGTQVNATLMKFVWNETAYQVVRINEIPSSILDDKYVVDSCDSTTNWVNVTTGGGNNEFSVISSPKQEGAGAFRVDYNHTATGSKTTIEKTFASTWTKSERLYFKFWIYNDDSVVAAAKPPLVIKIYDSVGGNTNSGTGQIDWSDGWKQMVLWWDELTKEGTGATNIKYFDFRIESNAALAGTGQHTIYIDDCFADNGYTFVTKAKSDIGNNATLVQGGQSAYYDTVLAWLAGGPYVGITSSIDNNTGWSTNQHAKYSTYNASVSDVAVTGSSANVLHFWNAGSTSGSGTYLYMAYGPMKWPQSVAFIAAIENTESTLNAHLNASRDWESAFTDCRDYWYAKLSGLSLISSNNLIQQRIRTSVMQILAHHYEPTGFNDEGMSYPYMYVRSLTATAVGLARYDPVDARKMVQFFSGKTWHNHYLADGTSAEMSNIQKTDYLASYLYASTKIYQISPNATYASNITIQVDSAVNWARNHLTVTYDHIICPNEINESFNAVHGGYHEHDYYHGLSDSTYGYLDGGYVKYEAYIDVFWCAAMRSAAYFYSALGMTANATFCSVVASALQNGIEDYRESSGELRAFIFSNGTRYNGLSLTTAMIYSAWLSNDQISATWLDTHASTFNNIVDMTIVSRFCPSAKVPWFSWDDWYIYALWSAFERAHKYQWSLNQIEPLLNNTGHLGTFPEAAFVSATGHINQANSSERCMPWAMGAFLDLSTRYLNGLNVEQNNVIINVPAIVPDSRTIDGIPFTVTPTSTSFGTFSVSSNNSVNIEMNLSTPYIWTAYSSTVANVIFTLSGLESGRMYQVYVDGVRYDTPTASGGSISFSYSGPWSQHEFEIIETSIGGSISGLVNVIFIMLAIGIVVGVTSETAYAFRKKSIPDDEMTRRLLNMVLYIIIGLALLGAAYATIS